MLKTTVACLKVAMTTPEETWSSASAAVTIRKLLTYMQMLDPAILAKHPSLKSNIDLIVVTPRTPEGLYSV